MIFPNLQLSMTVIVTPLATPAMTDDKTMKVEDMYRDAMRYVELRSIAMEQGNLEAVVAINQLDFCPSKDAFDAAVDKIIDAYKTGGKLL